MHRFRLLLLFVASAVGAGVGVYPSPVNADTILFPVIAVNAPNVTTIISVFNLSGDASQLRYIYRYKAPFVSGQPNLTGACNAVTFARPTAANDLLSFDASATFNSGNALFGDGDPYAGGFAIGLTGPWRAYLLVTHANSAGTRQDVGNTVSLGGEAIVMDIATGAAWGMKAINDFNREDFTFLNAFKGGGVFSALPSSTTSLLAGRFLPFFPPSEWTTRLFVTPIGTSMDTANLTATLTTPGAVVDRQGTLLTFPPIQRDVSCTGAVDVEAFFDSTALAAVENGGGFTWLGVTVGDSVIYKLEYVVNDTDYGGTVNNGYLFSAPDVP